VFTPVYAGDPGSGIGGLTSPPLRIECSPSTTAAVASSTPRLSGRQGTIWILQTPWRVYPGHARATRQRIGGYDLASLPIECSPLTIPAVANSITSAFTAGHGTI